MFSSLCICARIVPFQTWKAWQLLKDLLDGFGAFKEEKNKEDFHALDIMHFSSVGRIVTLVVKGDFETTKQIIQEMNPLMIDMLPVNLEEIFIYEMERKGVFVNE